MVSRIDERGAQAVQTGSDSTLDRALGLLEQFGNVAVAVAAEVRQLDRFAFARVEGRQRAAHRFGLRQIENVTLDVVEHGIDATRISRFAPTPRCLGSQQVDGSPVHRGQQERTKRPAFGIEAIRLIPESDEHFLHDLFGEAAVDEDPSGEAETSIALTSIHLRKRVRVASNHGAHQRHIVGSAKVDDGPRLPHGAPRRGDVGGGTSDHVVCSESTSRADDRSVDARRHAERGTRNARRGPGVIESAGVRFRIVQIEWPPEADAARARVRAFLDEHAPGGVFATGWNSQMAAAGYVAPHWPEPWGLGAGPWEQLAIDDELRNARAPRPMNPIGIGWAGPTLLVAGTKEQQQRFLPSLLDGSAIWCQPFSEPGAGSDLASLRTTAVRDGDEYIVNGQKVWTTLAHVSQFGILLARTRFDDDVADQESISYFVLDMRTPGVSVRPLVQMTGTHEFNEVFFDEVRIPAENLIGVEHDGWRLAKVTLGNERVSLSGEGALWGRGPTAGDVIDLVRANGGTTDPVVRQHLAALHIESEVLRLIRLRTLSARLRGLEPGPEASVRKALADEHGQHVMAMAMDLAGSDAMLASAGPYGDRSGMWSYGFLYSAALTIGGGTSEVQRNIIGERVLGLPK